MQSIVILLLLLIVVSLGCALLYVFADDGNNSHRAVWALTLRVVLSLLLFMVILVSQFTGWIRLHPLNGWM